MTLPQHLCSALLAEDVKTILKLCNCTVQTFEYIGNLFVDKFSKKYDVLTVGSALIVALGEFNARKKLRQRLVLLYLIYKVNEIDSSEMPKRLKNQTIERLQLHPFLPFLLFLMEGENAVNCGGSTNFIYTFTTVTLLPQERYLLGLLLTGRCLEVAMRSPVDFVQMVVHQEEVFDLKWLMTAVKLQQANYSSLAKASTPAFLKLFDEGRNLESAEDLDASLMDILANRRISDILPPSFYRFVPTLMPPSDDEFQFLYPFLLEPLWIDPETSRSEMSDDCNEKFDTEGNSGKTRSEVELLTMLCTDASNFNFKEKKTGGSLPCSPKTSLSVSNDSEARSVRAASICSLPPNLTSSSVPDKKPLSPDASPSKEVPAAVPIALETTKLLKEDAVQLLNKALKGVIARHDTQRLADAIASDPTIVDSVEIPYSCFPKFINDNPTIAAAVILERVKKNFNELPTFFEILTRMNPCVQGMEVVNKLCNQLVFPQEHLNRFISSCLQRCDDPTLSSASLCRQVRVICVFLSSLMRNKAWNVYSLSVELQSFALKYRHVREAASLYQAILSAMQSEVPEGESETHSALRAL